MRVEQCIDVDGTIYYLGDTVIVNGFRGHISQLKSQGMVVTEGYTDRIITYSDINELLKVELEAGELDWRRAYNNKL